MLPCQYGYKITSGSLGEQEIEVETRKLEKLECFHATVCQVLPNFHKCFFNIWEHRKNVYKITHRKLKCGNSLLYASEVFHVFQTVI